MLSNASIPFKRHWVQNKQVAIQSYVSLKMQQISKFKHLNNFNWMYKCYLKDYDDLYDLSIDHSFHYMWPFLQRSFLLVVLVERL